MNSSKHILDDLAEQLSDIAVVEKHRRSREEASVWCWQRKDNIY